MGKSVVIKSYNKGLAIHLDPAADMEDIKNDLAETFKASASFFKDACMVISFEDRELDSQTERDLVNIITANSSVRVSCIAGKNKITQAMITNALNQLEYKSEVHKADSVQIFRGSLKDGRVMDIPGSILILGDVFPDSTIIASGDIFIYGGLYGQAYAGNQGEEHHVIAALDMNPQKLRIAGVKYKPAEKPKWTIRSKQVPTAKAAILKDGVIEMENIDKNFWNSYLDSQEKNA